MSDNDTEVRFGADIADLISKLNEASSKMGDTASSMNENASKITESFNKVHEGISAAFEKINGAFLSVTAALAGGEAFKEVVEKTLEMSASANTLSRSLGITVEAGGALSETLGDIGSSSEQYMSISQRLGRQIKANEQGINDMGVATRNQDGTLKNQQDVMLNALAVLNQYRDGTDRNQAAMAIFGGRVGDITGLLRLNSEKIAETAEREKELGSTIYPHSIAAMYAYKDTMADVRDSIDAMQKVIGDAMIPRLTEMGDWFSQVAPVAVGVTQEVMITLIDTFKAFGQVVGAVYELVSLPIKAIGVMLTDIFGESGEPMTAMKLFLNMLKVIEIAVVVLDSSFKAAAIGAELLAKILTDPINTGYWIEQTKIKLQALTDETNKTIETIAMAEKEMSKPKPHDAVPVGGSKTAGAEVGKNTAAMSLMKEYEQQLLDMKLSYAKEGSEMTKEQESIYWQQVLAIEGKGSNDYLAILSKVQASELADLTKHIKEKLELQRMAIDEDKKRKLDASNQEEIMAKHKLAMGQIEDADLIKLQKKYEDDRFKIQQDAEAKLIELQLNDPNTDPVALQKLLDTMEKIQQDHANKVVDLQNSAAEQTRKVWLDNLAPITSAFDQSIAGMIQGTLTYKAAMNNMGQSILGEEIKRGVHWLTTKIANYAADTAAKTTSDSIKEAASTTGTARELADSSAVATVAVTNSAATAGAGVAANEAPKSGWFAIAEGAAAMAIVLGMLGMIKSSAGGEWQVPQDRLNLVHKDETILPANIATPLRQSVENGSFGGGGMNITIHALDSQSVQQFFNKHGDKLVNSLRGQNRNFNLG